jgi:hypothetical protein
VTVVAADELRATAPATPPASDLIAEVSVAFTSIVPVPVTVAFFVTRACVST